MRTCTVCGAICPGPRCAAHSYAREQDTRRPTARARGYDTAWQRLVAYVLHRDRRICYLCGLPGADSGDHVIPLSRGGARLDPANVRATHSTCNSGKRDRMHTVRTAPHYTPHIA